MSWFKRVVVWVAAMMLAGCAAVQQKPEELAATHGFVQVVIPQLGLGAPLAVRSITDRTVYPLPALTEGDGTLRGLWLPPGRYKLDRWVQSAVADMPAFEVRARRLTNLGTVIPVALGGNEMALLPVQDVVSARMAEETAQRLRSYLAEPEALFWQVPDAPRPFGINSGSTSLGLVADLLVLYEQHVNQTPIAKRLREARTPAEMLALAKEAAAPRTKEPAVDSQGHLYFGAALGQVRVRTAAGVWSSIDTGTLRTVTAVEWHDGSLVVGDEAGEIRATRDQGRTWTKLAALGPRVAVTDIDRVGSRWIVLAAGHRAGGHGLFEFVDRVTMHAATQDDLSDLKPLWNHASSNEYLIGPNWNGVRGEGTTRSYFFPAYLDLMQLDLAAAGVRKIPAPVRATGVHASAGGTVTAFLVMGAFSKLYVSADEGSTWVARDAPSLLLDDVIFASPQDGVATRWPMAAFSPQVVFERFDAVNNKWVPRDPGPAACRLVLQDAGGMPNFCVTGGGSILYRSAKGWGVEFAAE